MNMSDIYLVPGPTKPFSEVTEAYLQFKGSADLSSEFFENYHHTQTLLQSILGTQNDIIMMTGEGMLALWSALKSTLLPGDRVLALANGVFGKGIGEMAAMLGAEVKFIHAPFDQAFQNFDHIAEAAELFQPKIITLVHCETPAGLINPLKEISNIKKACKIPLFFVDAVSSIGGMPVEVDAHAIDLCIGGSQKVLSAPADMCFMSVSQKAWEIVEEVNYQAGYEALLPFKSALTQAYFPYTPHWQGIQALAISTEKILAEGLPQVFTRHETVAAFTREILTKLGFQLYVQDARGYSPTVTAAYLPQNLSWTEFQNHCLKQGVHFGGSYGPLANKIFRVGHMGSQANLELVQMALERIAL